MDNKEFFDKVAQMRTQQKAFFNSRPSSEERKTALVNSKRLEKEIDNEIARVQEIMARKETYLVQYQDVDALYDRITRWEGIPKVWKPGDEQKLEGKAIMEDIIGSLKKGVLRIQEQFMEPEPKGEARTLYAIAEMGEDETSKIIKQDIAKKGIAAIQANKLARKNTDKMFILYEQVMQVQETCHMTPFKAVQKPADQDELVEIDIKPKKKGKKPKETKE